MVPDSVCPPPEQVEPAPNPYLKYLAQNKRADCSLVYGMVYLNQSATIGLTDKVGKETNDWDIMITDTDFDGVGAIFTLRNAVYFAFGYSGGALIGIEQGLSHISSTFLGLGLGILLVAITLGFMYLMIRLAEDNIPTNEGLVGKTAKTYLVIKPGQSGKITININGATRELTATSNEEISTGSTVVIESIDNGVAHVVKQS